MGVFFHREPLIYDHGEAIIVFKELWKNNFTVFEEIFDRALFLRAEPQASLFYARLGSAQKVQEIHSKIDKDV